MMTIKTVHVVHYKSESCDDYYTAFSRKPSDKKLKEWFKKECPGEAEEMEEQGWSIFDIGTLEIEKVNLN